MHRDINSPKDLPLGSSLLNLDAKQEGHGTHWVAVYRTPSFVYYFDPLGAPNGGFPPICLRSSVPVVYNAVQYQTPSSTMCGYYSLYIATLLNRMSPKTGNEADALIRTTLNKDDPVGDAKRLIEWFVRHIARASVRRTTSP